MADFSVNVVTVEDVLPIEGADKIEVAVIGGYQSIIGKGHFKKGDLAAYIPEQSVLPLALIEEMGLVGKLAGSMKNRVKAIKLRGVLSQGLLYPYESLKKKADDYTLGQFPLPAEGSDVAAVLGVTKHEPGVPAHFAGQMSRPRGDKQLLNYDIENIKKYNRVLQEGEEVVFTEKIHGTLMQCAYFPDTDEFVVSSKGLGARGFAIEDNEANVNNTYIKAAKKHGLEGKIRALAYARKNFAKQVTPIFIVGEVFGKGVQDLTYGTEDIQYRAFDVYYGAPGLGDYVDAEFKYKLFDDLALPYVPVLYRGPFSQTVLEQFTNGKETVSGKQFNVREGVVINPIRERREKFGRVVLKSVSADYLTRKGGTEFN